MAKMTGGAAIVATLRQHGVDTVFGLPGVQLDNLFDALHGARQEVRTLHARHEQGAAYMALGYAQASGKVGVFAVVPWVGRADAPSDVPARLGEAFHAMLAGRHQPAVFEMAPDMMGATAEIAPHTPAALAPLLPDAGAIARAAQLLASARAPAIFVGSGVFGAEVELRAVAERLGAPVVMSRTGRGALPDRHPLALGMLGGQEIWDDIDVVLVVGSRFLAPALSWGRAGDVQVVRIDVDAAQINKPRQAGIAIIAHARPALAALAAALGAGSGARL